MNMSKKKYQDKLYKKTPEKIKVKIVILNKTIIFFEAAVSTPVAKGILGVLCLGLGLYFAKKK